MYYTSQKVSKLKIEIKTKPNEINLECKLYLFCLFGSKSGF